MLPSRLKTAADPHGHGQETWRKWYGLKAWQELRIRVFVRDAYICQMQGCGAVTAQPVADHIVPHRGDRIRFFDERNVQTLCKRCHDSLKQAEERRTPGG